ncbi:ester cyclase [Ktedonospora formicarum]|uniref:Ester cyclase n=1 Tax=Ktedonospora formicarum TaxID=2778364 RepID=A0A8J3IBG8_9CHLR|nr:ester cyclase [Ktedonospora formicarum]GHO50220.1 hypothetical protein KSX_83830 [Ktedonospora formicarum]
MSISANKAIAAKYVEMWDSGNTDIADEILADDFVDHSYPEQPPGPTSIKKRVTAYHQGFHNTHHSANFMLGEDNMVALYFTRRGKHKGMYAGFPPTGKEVVLTGADFMRIEHGKIAELWSAQDGLTWAQQIGLKAPN